MKFRFAPPPLYKCIVVFSLSLFLSFTFFSCGGVADDVPNGYGNVCVSFGSSSRNVTQGDKDNATLRVYFNGNQVEKNGNVFEDRVPIGTRLTITAEAVSSGRIIGKGEETITVRDGTNEVQMKIYTYDNFVVTIDGKSTGWTNFTDAWDAASGKTATLKMNADAASVAVTLSGGNVTLDLNGHTLRGASQSVITISGGTLTLKDTGTGGTITGSQNGAITVNPQGTFNMYGGIITGNNNSSTGGGGVDNDGTFIMSGGTITKNTCTGYGGGGVYNDGNFTMSGGTISGNSTSIKGGGVFNDSGTFVMSGGTISGNTSNEGGGVSHEGDFTMSGGIISGNTATTKGGGVDVWGGTFDISGTVNITGNTVSNAQNNLYLVQGEKINLTGTLNAASRIGVSMDSPGNFTSGWPTYKGSAVATTVFTSDEGLTIHDNTDTGEVTMYR